MADERRLAVKRMQVYIRDNIDREITLQDLARVAIYSPWHTLRLFKEMTGKTAFEYIRSLRLTLAAKRLRDSKDKIIDVALDFLFDSHEGFTRAFASHFNITPKAYQIRPVPIQYFTPYDILVKTKTERKAKMENTKTIFIQIMDRPKRKAIIKRGLKATDYFAYCEEVGCDIFGILTSVKEAMHEPMGMWLSRKLQRKGTSMYVQGVEVPIDYAGAIPEGFELIDLEATKIMVFQGEPYDDENFMEEVGLVMDSVAKFNPAVYGYEYAEDGYRFQFEPQGYRGYIEGRTVKKL